ncbi:hypothetical protein K9N68_33435 [Kovacikia minuta CCNUW1]|uniref:hypothetical protein n=1 Tax=Kovacikia minuta TaxID=2931930 RepID=UPI001CCA8442|nr:hypothetical protein [Kovacikia minuta]UBF26349.1 hypothetical protein K9N68_33435 [Kovacikia minuta CCNUW1]
MTYTSQESAAVVKAVMTSGLAIAVADLGIVSTAIEGIALAKEIAGAAQKYPNNSIIQGVFSEAALKQNPLEKPTTSEITPENAIDLAIAAINEAIVVLEPKASPDEIREFKSFIYASAESVANAAGSGLFGTGPKVSDKEAVALSELKAALAV